MGLLTLAKIGLSDACCQIEHEFLFTFYTSHVLFKLFLNDRRTFLQSFRITRNQCLQKSEGGGWRSFKPMLCSKEIPKSKSSIERIQSSVDYVRKIYYNYEKISLHHSIVLFFWGTRFLSTEELEIPNVLKKLKLVNHQLTTDISTFVCWAGEFLRKNYYHFASEMLPLNDMIYSNSHGKDSNRKFSKTQSIMYEPHSVYSLTICKQKLQ